MGASEGLTKSVWNELHVDGVVADETEVFRLVYFGGVSPEIRKEVWPYLVGHYTFGSTQDQRDELDLNNHNYYETTMSEWLAVEAIVRQRDKEKTAHAVAKLSSESGSCDKTKGVPMDCEMENDVFETNGISDISDAEGYDEEHDEKKVAAAAAASAEKEEVVEKEGREETEKEKSGVSTPSTSSYETVGNEFLGCDTDPSVVSSPMENSNCHAVIVTKASIDIVNALDVDEELMGNVQGADQQLPPVSEEQSDGNTIATPALDALQEPKSNCVSPASSNGGVYSVSLVTYLIRHTLLKSRDHLLTFGICLAERLVGTVWFELAPDREGCESVRPELLLLFKREHCKLGQVAKHHLHVRVGALGSRIHAGNVRLTGTDSGHFRRRIDQLRLLLQTHGTDDRKLPQWRCDGHALCQHEVSGGGGNGMV